MLHEPLLRSELESRIARLQQSLRREGLSGFLVTQHLGLYYLIGSMQAGYAFVPADGNPVFYVRRSVSRAQSESAVRVEPLPSLRSLRLMLERDFPGLFSGADAGDLRIAADMDVLPAQLCRKLEDQLAGAAKLVDGSALLRAMRMIKSPWEIGRIEAAAQAAHEALFAALNDLRAGMTEQKLMGRIEFELRLRGHIGIMRTRGYNMEILTGMIGAGEAAAEPSAFDGPAGGRGLGSAAAQSVSMRPIGRNEPILLDVGCCIDGYVIDQTRTAVIGELPDDLAAAYAITEAIVHRSEQLMKPGVSPEALYAAALEQAAEAGLSEHFMGYGDDRVKFLGHGIGLEVDEWPVLARGFREPLAAGMVLAVEPKFTFPGRGVVGIENSYLVAPEGPRALTRSPEGLITLP
ncbi:M24 family metallopeptidase [Paenibacillus humicola]|uniref:M24 family metallopeptidase n=1 Tax=Paenibacillus humicola TaxID=3110540 RepID=UPI00237AF630|nr:Xaa-Pro peptidase family protein [Paenibacillus humicola]